MNGYNFTDRVRKALRYARDEADRLHHEYVGPEHILLGVLREGEGVASALLSECHVDAAALRARLEAAVKPGNPSSPVGRDLPYTSHAKKVLEGAMTEARALGFAYVGTEHLLLGLLRTQATPAADALAEAGLTLDQARAAAVRLRGSESPPRSPARVWPPVDAERRSRLALLVALTALAVAILALALALRA